MSTVTSADGTSIAYSKTGSGPALLLVDGAMCHRGFGPSSNFAEGLSDAFTVYTYDRRGRGESGDTEPYDVQREVEDLAAVVKATGEQPCVFGQSSGAALALEAANNGVPMHKLAVFEAPFAVTPGSRSEPPEYLSTLTGALAAGKNGKAVKLFMRQVGVPAPMLALFPLMPMWSKLKAVAPTLPYDRALLAHANDGTPLAEDRYAGVTVPTLAMAGGKSDEWFRDAMRQITERVQDGTYRTVEGQNHMLKASAVTPILREFFQD